MNLKAKWKNLSYIKKGGIIGGVLGIIYIISFLILATSRIYTPFDFIWTLALPVFLFAIFACGWEGQGAMFPNFCDNHYAVGISFYIFVIFYAVLGSLFGMLIAFLTKKIKDKKIVLKRFQKS